VRIGHIGDLQFCIYTNNLKTRGKTPLIMVQKKKKKLTQPKNVT
jgi:hypothetical protein